MKPAFNVATLIERYFTDRLMRQRNVSPNTIASYRDTFRLLFTFAQARLRKSPSDLALGDLDASFIGTFLTDLEMKRGASVKTSQPAPDRHPLLLPVRVVRGASAQRADPARARYTEQAPRQATGALPDASRDRGNPRHT